MSLRSERLLRRISQLVADEREAIIEMTRKEVLSPPHMEEFGFERNAVPTSTWFLRETMVRFSGEVGLPCYRIVNSDDRKAMALAVTGFPNEARRLIETQVISLCTDLRRVVSK